MKRYVVTNNGEQIPCPVGAWVKFKDLQCAILAMVAKRDANRLAAKKSPQAETWNEGVAVGLGMAIEILKPNQTRQEPPTEND